MLYSSLVLWVNCGPDKKLIVAKYKKMLPKDYRLIREKRKLAAQRIISLLKTSFGG